MPATFHFYLRDDQPNKQGKCAIYLRITLDRKLKYYNTGIKILPDQWNVNKERIRKNHNTYNKLNQDLDKVIEKAQQTYRNLDREGRASAEAIKARIEGTARNDFFTLAGEYLKQLSYENKYHSHKQAKVPLRKLKRMHGSDQLPLSMIDVSFMERFQSYLQAEYDNKPSTIRKNLDAIRAILDIAVKDHLIKENPLRSQQFTLVKANKSSYKAKLSFQQIQSLANAKIKKGTNRFHARNAFLLSFYFCGIRFGDLASLRWENVRGGRLRYKMGKTEDYIDVKIPDGAYRFLDFYDHTDKKESDFILPFLQSLSERQAGDPKLIRKKISSANAIVNDRLKKIAKQGDVNIKENLSMHVARHSFAQYATDIKEIPTYKMMMLLGHKNIKTTQQYLKTISVKTVDAAMEQIF